MARALSAVAALLVAAGVAGCSGSNGSAAARPTTPRTEITAIDTTRTDTREVDTSCDPLPDLPEKRLVYTQTRQDGTEAVFLMKRDGTDRRCLVDTAGPDSYPAWSPDGRWVAFIGGAVEGQDDIYVVRADGTRLRRLTETDAIETTPIWSPDGTRIGYTSEDGVDGLSTIHVISRDGSQDSTVIAQSGEVGHPELHDWAPASETLLFGAYERRTGLWTVRVDGTHRRFLRGGPGDYGSGAAYSPDGSSIVFQADLDGGCIYKSDALLLRVQRVTERCIDGFRLTWSPDGRWIAWAGGAHGPSDARVMRSDGTRFHTIADGSDVASLDWQPSTTR